jgi:DNA-binding response OmpR family regulator
MMPSVLLVDAFRDEREMYADYLTATGFRVRSFDNTAAALKDAAVNAPCAVVVRLHPRRPSGIERLRVNPATRQAPIVALSTSTLDSERRAALKAGCSLWVLLPCLPEELAVAIDEVTRRAQPCRRTA